MVSKRRAPDRDDEDAGREYSEHKQPRLELDADLIADQSYSSMHTILLSGFTWDEQVAGPHVSHLHKPFDISLTSHLDYADPGAILSHLHGGVLRSSRAKEAEDQR